MESPSDIILDVCTRDIMVQNVKEAITTIFFLLFYQIQFVSVILDILIHRKLLMEIFTLQN